MNREPGTYRPDNAGLFPIEVDGKHGFIDIKGEVVIEPQFGGAQTFSEGLAGVRVGDKWGFIDKRGKLRVTPQFDAVTSFRYGRATVKLCCGDWGPTRTDQKVGFIDESGTLIGAPEFVWAGLFGSRGLAPVQLATGGFAFVDRSGKLPDPLIGVCDELQEGFSAGVAPCSKNGLWGFIAPDGSWVLDPQFEWAGAFGEGLAPVRAGGSVGFVDKKGSFVVNPQFYAASSPWDGLAAFVTNSSEPGGRLLGFLDAEGQITIEPTFPSSVLPYFSDGLAAVQSRDGDGGWGFIDRSGAFVIEPVLDEYAVFVGGLALVRFGGQSGYITPEGRFVWPDPELTVADLVSRKAERRRLLEEQLQRGALASADPGAVESPAGLDWAGGAPDRPIPVAGDVVPPSKLHSPGPVYTESARQARIEGTVILVATIDKHGNVTSVKVLKGLPMGLEDAAVAAVKRWRFKPATLNGEPVAVYYNLAVNFRIE